MRYCSIFYLSISLCFSSMAFGHGGGLDEYGCHNDNSNGTRHCHNDSSSGTSSKGSSSSRGASAAVAVLVLAGLGYWCYLEHKKKQ
jgi:hypothetical protein